MTKSAKKAMFDLGAGLCMIASFIFISWAIQSAWLGSFPNRDVALYTRWAGMQFGAGILFFVTAILAIFMGIRISKTIPNEPPSNQDVNV